MADVWPDDVSIWPGRGHGMAGLCGQYVPNTRCGQDVTWV